ncbi:hypothetical protein AXF42_Ash014996 [Apostasia shenzhenica]|uniref:Biogenesis of lysosome-related organelles complex 1 subunit 7 n=1 Tax=Apostasia shenzhenica TaxID=1088818 RepID=A0A2I0B2U3_9ASPA|nr:hypothetical protein AXF42_Ash014996 [Apostasia shenzhenica]
MASEDHAPQPAEPLEATKEKSGAADANLDRPNSNKVESSSRRYGCEALGRAISSTLGAVMMEFDSRTESAARSQDDLSSSLNRLIGELDKLLEDAPLAFIMQNAAKISSVRRRVSSLNSVLKSIQRRLDSIDRRISIGLPDSNS